MPTADNDADLTALLIREMTGVIDVVAIQLVEKLKEKIDEYVYDAYPNPVWYPRFRDSGGLRGEWKELNRPTVSGNTVHQEINEDPDSMVHDPDGFIHGSNYWTVTDDIREYLAEIVIEGKSGPLFGEDGPWRLPRDFWTPFLELLTNGTADQLLEAEFSKRGITYIKI